MGKPKDPEYWKKWRAQHPEYRERERQRMKRRERGDRSGEHRRRAARLRAKREAEVHPALQTHPLLRCARCMVASVMKQDGRLMVYDDVFDEAVAEALYSWALGEDPMEGVRRVRADRKRWRGLHLTGLPVLSSKRDPREQ